MFTEIEQNRSAVFIAVKMQIRWQATCHGFSDSDLQKCLFHLISLLSRIATRTAHISCQCICTFNPFSCNTEWDTRWKLSTEFNWSKCCLFRFHRNEIELVLSSRVTKPAKEITGQGIKLEKFRQTEREQPRMRLPSRGIFAGKGGKITQGTNYWKEQENCVSLAFPVGIGECNTRRSVEPGLA